jgi:hypothetical protein
VTLAADTYGYSLDPTHSNPVFWPLPRGGTVEVNVPVETAAAGAPKITGVVQLADGDLDPILEPSIVPIIDSTAQAASSDADAVSISYATPMITSQTVLNASTITVGFSGIVWNNSVTTVGNFADCQRRCSISWKVARRECARDDQQSDEAACWYHVQLCAQRSSRGDAQFQPLGRGSRGRRHVCREDEARRGKKALRVHRGCGNAPIQRTFWDGHGCLRRPRVRVNEAWRGGLHG